MINDIYAHLTQADYDNEEWRAVDGFPGYIISNLGRLKSISRLVKKENGVLYPVNEKIMKLSKDKDGYLRCGMCFNGVKTRLVSRIVAIAFVENDLNKPEVNHKNGIKTDNRVSNLEWSTRSENELHAFQNGLAKPSEKQKMAAMKTGLFSGGENHGGCKLKDSDVKEIIRLRKEKNLTYKKIGDMFSVSPSHVCSICTGNARTKTTPVLEKH